MTATGLKIFNGFYTIDSRTTGEHRTFRINTVSGSAACATGHGCAIRRQRSVQNVILSETIRLIGAGPRD